MNNLIAQSPVKQKRDGHPAYRVAIHDDGSWYVVVTEVVPASDAARFGFPQQFNCDRFPKGMHEVASLEAAWIRFEERTRQLFGFTVHVDGPALARAIVGLAKVVQCYVDRRMYTTLTEVEDARDVLDDHGLDAASEELGDYVGLNPHTGTRVNLIA